MTDTGNSPEGQLSIEQFSDLKEDFVFPKGLEGQTLIFFIKYLTGWSRHDKFMRLWALFGDDLLLFLSIFQGETLRIPPVNTLLKMKDNCRIYTFLWERNFSDQGYILCGRIFRKKRYDLERIVQRVERVIARVEGKGASEPS